MPLSPLVCSQCLAHVFQTLVVWPVAEQIHRKVSLQLLVDWTMFDPTHPQICEMPPNVQQDTTIRISSVNNIQLASQSKRSRRSNELGLLQILNCSDASLANLVKSTDPFLKLLQGRADQEVTDGWQRPFHRTAGMVQSTIKIHCWSLS